MFGVGWEEEWGSKEGRPVLSPSAPGVGPGQMLAARAPLRQVGRGTSLHGAAGAWLC